MFTNSLIVLQQIIVMFLLILMGYVLFRRNVFTNQTTQSLTVLLNKYIVFFVLLRSFQRPFDAHLGYALGVTFVCSMLFFLISIALANRVYRPEKTENYADCRVSVVLTNNGFMALPLLDAMFGAGRGFPRRIQHCLHGDHSVDLRRAAALRRQGGQRHPEYPFESRPARYRMRLSPVLLACQAPRAGVPSRGFFERSQHAARHAFARLLPCPDRSEHVLPIKRYGKSPLCACC